MHKLTGPDVAHGVVTKAQHYAFQSDCLKRINKRRLPHSQAIAHEVTRPTLVFINHGRTVIECTCGAGCVASREWNVALCCGCGAQYVNLTWPEDFERLAAALSQRERPEHRNWMPGEPIEFLLAENASQSDLK